MTRSSIWRAIIWTAKATPAEPQEFPTLPQRRRPARRRLRRPLHDRQPAGDRQLLGRQRVHRYQRQSVLSIRRATTTTTPTATWSFQIGTVSDSLFAGKFEPAALMPERQRRLRQARRLWLRQLRQGIPLPARLRSRRRVRPADRQRLPGQCHRRGRQLCSQPSGRRDRPVRRQELVPRHQRRQRARSEDRQQHARQPDRRRFQRRRQRRPGHLRCRPQHVLLRHQSRRPTPTIRWRSAAPSMASPTCRSPATYNLDGIDDLGIWVPNRQGSPTPTTSEWYFLISDRIGQALPSNVVRSLRPDAARQRRVRPIRRSLLAADLWQLRSAGGRQQRRSIANQRRQSLDVNNDGYISPNDAVIVINQLNPARSRR